MTALILLIEDNVDNLQLTTYLLNYYGYQIISAVTGKEGIRLVEEKTPDLILCDVDLPDISGYEVAKIIKNNLLINKIPLIAITALSMQSDKQRISESGFDLYISKPINPQKFIEEIAGILEKEKFELPTQTFSSNPSAEGKT